MCAICLLSHKMNIKEKLNAFNEVYLTSTEDVEHLNEVHGKLLKEYAEEISKEVMALPYDQLTFADFVEDWSD